MDLADQIAKLHALYEAGALSPDEFAAAKRALLEPSGPPDLPSRSNQRPRPGDDPDQSLGRAANRYMNLQIVVAVIGAVVFLTILFGFFLPLFNRMGPGFPR